MFKKTALNGEHLNHMKGPFNEGKIPENEGRTCCINYKGNNRIKNVSVIFLVHAAKRVTIFILHRVTTQTKLTPHKNHINATLHDNFPAIILI